MNGKKTCIIFAALAGILWGGAGVFVRLLADYGMNSVTILEVKTGFAVLMMLILILIKDPSLLRVSRIDLVYMAILGVVGALILNIMYNYAIVTLSLSLTAVIFSLSVFMVPLISSRMFGEHMSWKQYVCMALAVLGCAMVSGLFEGGIIYSVIGIAAAFGAAVCNAIFNIVSKKLLNRGCHSYTINLYVLAAGAIAAIPLSDWGTVFDALTQDTARCLIIMLGQSFLMSVLPGILYMQSIKGLNTATATALEVGLEPPAAMLFGMILYAEIPSAIMVLGLIIVVAALVWMSREEGRE